MFLFFCSKLSFFDLLIIVIESAYFIFLVELLFFISSFLNFQLAGVVAVEITGGPTIPFVPGRKVSIYMKRLLRMFLDVLLLLCKKVCWFWQDSMASPEEGRLLDANQG